MLVLLIFLLMLSSLNASIVYTSTSGEYSYYGKGTHDEPYIGSSLNTDDSSSASITFTTTVSGIVTITTNVESEPCCDFAYLYYNGTEEWKGSGLNQYNMYFTTHVGDTFEFKYSKDSSVSTYSDYQGFSIYFMGIPTSYPTSYPTNIPISVPLPIEHTSTSGNYYYSGMGTFDEPYIGNSRNHVDPSSASITFTTTASGMVYILTNVEAVYRMDGPYGGAFFYHNDVEKWRGYGIKKYSSSFNAQIGDTFQFKYEKYDTYSNSGLADQQEFSIYFVGIPTSYPTSIPTVSPSTLPTSTPTNIPTMPSSVPTTRPSSKPTYIPTYAPTNPTSIPTKQPIGQPSSVPTSVPSNPSGTPTGSPTGSPTGAPTSVPTSPSGAPTSVPTSPSSAPTSVPNIPSSTPTNTPTPLVYPIKCNSNTINDIAYRNTSSLMDTKSALQNYHSVEIEIEDGTYVDFSTCVSNGDTYIRLYNKQGVMLAEDDDGCDYNGCGCGSKIVENIEVSDPFISNIHYIHLGCWYNTTCDMTLEMKGCREITGSEPTFSPSETVYLEKVVTTDESSDDTEATTSIAVTISVLLGIGIGVLVLRQYIANNEEQERIERENQEKRESDERERQRILRLNNNLKAERDNAEAARQNAEAARKKAQEEAARKKAQAEDARKKAEEKLAETQRQHQAEASARKKAQEEADRKKKEKEKQDKIKRARDAQIKEMQDEAARQKMKKEEAAKKKAKEEELAEMKRKHEAELNEAKANADKEKNDEIAYRKKAQEKELTEMQRKHDAIKKQMEEEAAKQKREKEELDKKVSEMQQKHKAELNEMREEAVRKEAEEAARKEAEAAARKEAEDAQRNKEHLRDLKLRKYTLINEKEEIECNISKERNKLSQTDDLTSDELQEQKRRLSVVQCDLELTMDELSEIQENQKRDKLIFEQLRKYEREDQIRFEDRQFLAQQEQMKTAIQQKELNIKQLSLNNDIDQQNKNRIEREFNKSMDQKNIIDKGRLNLKMQENELDWKWGQTRLQHEISVRDLTRKREESHREFKFNAYKTILEQNNKYHDHDLKIKKYQQELEFNEKKLKQEQQYHESNIRYNYHQTKQQDIRHQQQLEFNEKKLQHNDYNKSEDRRIIEEQQRFEREQIEAARQAEQERLEAARVLELKRIEAQKEMHAEQLEYQYESDQLKAKVERERMMADYFISDAANNSNNRLLDDF